MVFAMAMSLGDFTADKQNLFEEALAAAARVTTADVSIDKVEEIARRRRRLLSASTRVEVSITVADAGAAETLKTNLTVDVINAELQKVGLPAVEILADTCPKDTYQHVNVSSSCIPCPEGSSTYDVTGATSADQCLKITEPPDFICQCHVPLWREFHDCNHHPTWVNMTVTLPYAQADFPEDTFKMAIGGAVFGGGPEEGIADRRVEVLSVEAAGSVCVGVPSVNVSFVVRVPDDQAPCLTSPQATSAQPVQAKLTTANINGKLAEHGVSHACAIVSAPTPVSRGSNCKPN